MIKIIFVAGRACPNFTCDVCGKPIAAPKWAMAAWGEGAGVRDAGALLPVSHLHKRACLDAFEVSLPDDRLLMTDELIDHLAYLVGNTGVAVEVIDSRLREST